MSDKLITQTAVLDLGFTRAMIAELLPEPILRTNPRHKSGPPMRLYREHDVLAVMQTEQFLVLRQKAEIRRQGAKKSVDTKAAKAAQQVDCAINHITVRRVDIDDLRAAALASRQEWYDQHYNPYNDLPPSAYGADHETECRWMVNYIRHNLTDYDGALMSMSGKVGKQNLYARYRAAILDKIALVYPELKKECEKQKGEE